MISAKKSLGQHFLVDRNIARNIVAACEPHPSDIIVEIGPGQGALTGLLAETGARIICIEIDGRAAEVLHGQIAKEGWSNIEVIHEDVLRYDFSALAGDADAPLKIIGNLPYNITSQILFRLIEYRAHIGTAIMMMQKEVADRIISAHGTKEYGILSVLLQVNAAVRKLFKVSPNVFKPKPKVWSAVLRADFTGPHLDAISDYVHFTRTVKAAFGQRRKKLSNSLRNAGMFGEHVPEAAREFLDLRPEQLDIQSFIRLSNTIATHG